MLTEEDFKRACNDALPVLRPLVQEQLLQNFDAEGRPQRWPQLAASTVRRRGSAHPILVETGRLRQAVASCQTYLQKNILIVKVSGPRAEVAHWHQFGTRRMPARPPLQLTQEQIGEQALSLGEAVCSILERKGYAAKVSHLDWRIG